MARESLSSGHFSHDQQLTDVLNHLTPDQWAELVKVFPELDGDDGIVFEATSDGVALGSWDLKKMGVDVEYSQWVTDWIEEHTDIHWENGEPWRGEEEEDDDEEAP